VGGRLHVLDDLRVGRVPQRELEEPDGVTALGDGDQELPAVPDAPDVELLALEHLLVGRPGERE
jgi:hypothetical protein